MHHRRLQYLIDMLVALYDNALRINYDKTGKVSSVELRHTPYTDILIKYFYLDTIDPNYFYGELLAKILTRPEWIASCPWNLNRCKINPDSSVLKDLCKNGLMLQPKLCEGETAAVGTIAPHSIHSSVTSTHTHKTGKTQLNTNMNTKKSSKTRKSSRCRKARRTIRL
jgi:hypothetical protein